MLSYHRPALRRGLLLRASRVAFWAAQLPMPASTGRGGGAGGGQWAAQALLEPRVMTARQSTSPYVAGLPDVAGLFCFACLFLLENELRSFYPRLQVGLVMKGPCRAQGALGEERSHLQALLLKIAFSVGRKKKRKLAGRIRISLAFVRLPEIPG